MRWWLTMSLALVLAGCSADDGQQRFRVTGSVKLAGEPVPAGEVLFTPDGAKGNSGAQGIADIKNGRYDTAGSRAPGIAGGPTIIRVTALSSEGKLLAEHEVQLDLPKGDTTHDIDIPVPGAAPPPETPEI
jgi:hypothetical protein